MSKLTGIRVTQEGEDVQIHIPMIFKKRGGRKEIIVPESLESFLPSRPVYQEALVIAIARAHRWKEMLDSGKYGSVAELADRLSIDGAYVARLLRFTLLAPDIIEAIFEGRDPSGFSIGKLVGAIPMDWEEQRKVFGFSG